MREISNYFWRASLLYKRLILYFACLHKFYWINIPTQVNFKQSKNNKNEKNYYEALNYIQKFNLSNTTPDILNAVFREGAFYGYLNEGDTYNTWQPLPIAYCRSNYTQNGISVIEFNIKYFDDAYRQEEDRTLAIKKYPAEFKSWYSKYKKGTIISSSGSEVWVPLNAEFATKFSVSNDECPVFFSIIIEIIRLEKNKKIVDEQALQQLFKLLVQKMPLNKNDDLIFDVEETKAIHRNASNMLAKAPGVDLFTTWADVEMLNIDTTDAQTKTALIATPESFWQETGVSPMLFSTNGNLSLNPSQKKDTAIVCKILESYANFINMKLSTNFNMKQIKQQFKFIDVTIFNQEDMIKIYKEQATLGYSKLLVAIASGINQIELTGLIDFENNSLNLINSLVPLKTSYTDSANNQGSDVSTTTGGRPALAEEQKAEGTIGNIT